MKYVAVALGFRHRGKGGILALLAPASRLTHDRRGFPGGSPVRRDVHYNRRWAVVPHGRSPA